MNSDSSDWLVVANSNQDCETASKTPVLFGEDVDTSCDLKCVTMTTTQFLHIHVIASITDSSDDCSQMAAMTTNFFTTFNKQYIGSYGNANPDQLSQWIDVIGYNESLDDVVCFIAHVILFTSSHCRPLDHTIHVLAYRRLNNYLYSLVMLEMLHIQMLR